MNLMQEGACIGTFAASVQYRGQVEPRGTARALIREISVPSV
jgi:hypothetical protein